MRSVIRITTHRANTKWHSCILTRPYRPSGTVQEKMTQKWRRFCSNTPLCCGPWFVFLIIHVPHPPSQTHFFSGMVYFLFFSVTAGNGVEKLTQNYRQLQHYRVDWTRQRCFWNKEKRFKGESLDRSIQTWPFLSMIEPDSSRLWADSKRPFPYTLKLKILREKILEKIILRVPNCATIVHPFSGKWARRRKPACWG